LLFKEDPNLLHGVVTMVSPTYLQSQNVSNNFVLIIFFYFR
jgi:hypothetical protein